MPITFRCAKCKQQYKVSSKHSGKKIDCKGCHAKIQIPVVNAAVVQPQAVVAPPPAAMPSFPTAAAAPQSPPPAAAPAPGFQHAPPQPPQKMAVPMPAMPPQPPQRIAVPMPPAAGQAFVQAMPVEEEEMQVLSPDDIVSDEPIDMDPDDFVSIQSEWVVECDDCGRKHKPDEGLMGKRIRCKCGSILHLSENVNAGLMVAKDEDALPMLQPLAEAAPAPGQGFQSAPPSFHAQSAGASYEQQLQNEKRNNARALLQRAEGDRVIDRHRAAEGTEEWGPMGKIIGGVALIAGGIILGVIAWEAGYIVGASAMMVVMGLLSIGAGLVESVTK